MVFEFTGFLRFRWPFCQLDILSGLKSAVDLHRALGQLPVTLFETYDGILAGVAAENVKFARVMDTSTIAHESYLKARSAGSAYICQIATLR